MNVILEYCPKCNKDVLMAVYDNPDVRIRDKIYYCPQCATEYKQISSKTLKPL